MRKALGVLILLLAGASAAFAQVGPPQLQWKTEPLRFRTLRAAYPNGGAADSALITWTTTGAELDTSIAISSRVYPHLLPDSSQTVIVWVSAWGIGTEGTTAQSIDVSDSVYIALDGSNDNGQTWQIINGANIGINGFGTGQAVLAGARGSVIFLGKPNSTTNVTGRSPGILPTSNYGGWLGYSLLRVRTWTSTAWAAALQAKVYITYPTNAK